jgi:hypothetical protein
VVTLNGEDRDGVRHRRCVDGGGWNMSSQPRWRGCHGAACKWKRWSVVVPRHPCLSGWGVNLVDVNSETHGQMVGPSCQRE